MRGGAYLVDAGVPESIAPYGRRMMNRTHRIGNPLVALPISAQSATAVSLVTGLITVTMTSNVLMSVQTSFIRIFMTICAVYTWSLSSCVQRSKSILVNPTRSVNELLNVPFLLN